MTTRADQAALWPLDPSIAFLNHGSFGACPAEVLRHQAALRAEMEAEPVRFLSRELDDRLDAARGALAGFLGAEDAVLGLVPHGNCGRYGGRPCLVLHLAAALLIPDHAFPLCRPAREVEAERVR